MIVAQIKWYIKFSCHKTMNSLQNYYYYSYSYESFSTREISLKIELGTKGKPNKAIGESQIESSLKFL
jgi:hypothetical protein